MKEIKENIKFVIIKILYIIIIPIIIYDLILIAQTIINPYKTPNFFGIKTFNIVSGSMEPQISINDIVIIKEIGKRELEVGDIISFNLNGEIITHRITNIENKDDDLIYTTKGDNNEVTDIEQVRYEQIEGKQVGLIPKLGTVLNILKNKIVFAIVLTILLTCFMIERKKFSSKIRRKEKRIEWETKRGHTPNAG